MEGKVDLTEEGWHGKDVIAAEAAGDTRFEDDFLEMMQHGQDQNLKQRIASEHSTNAMKEKGEGQLLKKKEYEDVTGGHRLTDATNLATKKVDKVADGKDKGEAQKPLPSVGKSNKTHEEAAQTTTDIAPKTHREVTDGINQLPLKGASIEAMPHVPDTVDTISKNIPGVATKESGQDPKDLEEWECTPCDKCRRSSGQQMTSGSQLCLTSLRKPQPQMTQIQGFSKNEEPIKSEKVTKATGYKVLAREAVISEMQNRGSEILAEVNEDTESYFYSAQRLKRSKKIVATAPREQIQEQLSQKLGEMIKGRGTPRKVAPYIKDYVQKTTGYLSEHVTIPDCEIDAYIALLTEAEIAGDKPLVEGKIHKTHAEAVAYWRKLTTFDDEINRPDATMQASIENKLNELMEGVTRSCCGKSHLNTVIQRNARLLTSYVKLQEEKSDVLKLLVEQMDKEKCAVLLRHGRLRKTHLDGANLLRTKTADQLSVTNVDPVVSRKIQIKLRALANKSFATNKYKDLINDVVDDVSDYLAVHFLQPEIVQVCKCMKNVIVQCELWCEGSLRQIGRVCSRRSRHVSIHDLLDVCPGRAIQVGPCGPRICGSGVEVYIRQCPEKHGKSSQTCSVSKPAPGCRSNITAGYVLNPSHGGPFDNIPTKLSATECSEELTTQTSETGAFSSNYNLSGKDVPYSDHSETQTVQALTTFEKKTLPNISSLHMFGSTPTVMFAGETNSSVTVRPKVQSQNSWMAQTRNIHSSQTPIVTTDQMTDWHSMMVSIMWNVRAWKTWIYNSIKKILTFQENIDLELDKTWLDFQRNTTTEILQWTQYKSFSRQLIIRIASKYSNKKIVSPTRTAVKTRNFIDIHNEMLDLIEMFNRWTHWLTDAIIETDSLRKCKDSSSERCRTLEKKVKEQLKEWEQCDDRLYTPWESRFKKQLSEWVPGWRQPGPLWVISACGAVPGAAVSAGVFDGEDTFVARTTHNCKILPAALCPSMHCCILYYEGRIYHYTKYQVLCNVSVEWLGWRGGSVPERAVRVGAVYVGRVRYRASYLLGAVVPPHYRCHVVMYSRPVAFDCYEILLMGVDT